MSFESNFKESVLAEAVQTRKRDLRDGEVPETGLTRCARGIVADRWVGTNVPHASMLFLITK